MRRLFKFAAVLTGLVAGGILAAAESLPSAARDDTRSTRRSGGTGIKSRLIKIALLLLVLASGGFLVAASGIIPLKASSGHWAVTEWFLNFSMERSVSTHSLGLEAPPLDKPSLVQKGAGHYEIGCSPCHGNPELPNPRIAQAMTPKPPYLPSTVPQWEPEELFYIVKHGVKFTGMPAWPSEKRDDEVWAIVAFLRRFPKLDAEEYRQLAGGAVGSASMVAPIEGDVEPRSALRSVIESCDRCHGAAGSGRGMGAFPKLARQQPAYIDLSLQAYARGQRHSGMMEPIAAGLSFDEMRELARYYASLPEPLPAGQSQEDAAALDRGEQIAFRGIPSQRVPACAVCHGPGDTPRNPVYPVLAGQHADYLALQLELFKNERRGGTEYAHIMRRVAAGLNPEQIRDVALYYQSLASAAGRGSQ